MQHSKGLNFNYTYIDYSYTVERNSTEDRSPPWGGASSGRAQSEKGIETDGNLAKQWRDLNTISIFSAHVKMVHSPKHKLTKDKCGKKKFFPFRVPNDTRLEQRLRNIVVVNLCTPALIDETSSLLKKLFESDCVRLDPGLHLPEYRKASSQNYHVIRRKFYQQEELHGDIRSGEDIQGSICKDRPMISVAERPIGERPTFESRIPFLSSVKGQSSNQPDKGKAVLVLLKKRAIAAHTQAVVYDLLCLSDFFHVPEPEILLTNSKKATSRKGSCYKSDALETFVGKLCNLQKQCIDDTSKKLVSDITDRIALLCLHVAAILHEMSVRCPKDVDGIGHFPETAADTRAIQRNSFSLSMTSGWGCGFDDSNMDQFRHAEMSGYEYDGGDIPDVFLAHKLSEVQV
jgi:hypothetical protein